jgi:hypothetical protein
MDPMKIEYLQTDDEQDWAWLTEGHVDIDAFERAVREQFPDAPNSPLLHTYIRATCEKRDDFDVTVFCARTADGARPVTAAVADDWWEAAAEHAL